MPLPRSLYPGERPSTHYIGGWIDLRAGLDRCGKSGPLGFNPWTVRSLTSQRYRLSYPGPWHTHTHAHTINSYKSDNSPVIIRNHQLPSYLTTGSKCNETLFLKNVQYCCILAVECTFTELRNKGYHSVLSLQEVVYADLQPSAWESSTVAVSGEKNCSWSTKGTKFSNTSKMIMTYATINKNIPSLLFPYRPSPFFDELGDTHT
jgi:hypothetical protein